MNEDPSEVGEKVVESKRPQWTAKQVAFGAFLLVGIIWIGNLIVGIVAVCDDGKLGEAGDAFGIGNALFSGLAFAAFLVALWMQSEELNLQRQELRDTRAEFARQTAIQREHLELLRQERRERELSERTKFSPALMLRETFVASGIGLRLRSDIYNGGARIFDLHVTNVRIDGERFGDGIINPDTILESGGKAEITVEGIDSGRLTDKLFEFDLYYIDALQVKRIVSLSSLIE